MAITNWRNLLDAVRPTRPRLSERRHTGCRLRIEPLEPRMLLTGDPITLGPQTSLFDQPYVQIEMFRDEPPVGMGPYGSAMGMGVYPFNYFLLDTGANSILSAKEPTQDMASEGYQTEGTFLELGVSGYSEFDVSAPYRFDFQGTDAVAHTLPQTADQVRILSSESIELLASVAEGGIAGIVGMPAMTGRVTTLDMSDWADVDDIFDLTGLGVEFSNDVPADNGHRYSVAVDTRIQFDPEDGRPPEDPDGPLPVWADIPFLTAKAEYQDAVQPGSFLLDTGAQMSMISTSLAASLGLSEADALYYIEVGGIGGTRSVPVVLIDGIRIPTQEGPELVWTGTDPDELGIEVIIIDIAPGIEGILGVDLLTTGMDVGLDPITWELIFVGAPHFEKMHFDFRNWDQGAGTLYFDVYPYHVAVSESDGLTEVGENGLSDTYEIVLWEPPTENVQIDLIPADAQVVAVDAANSANDYLLFTPADWNVPQQVLVTAVDDSVLEGAHTGLIAHRSLSTDEHYDNLRIALVEAQVADNEASSVAGRHVFYNNSAFDGRDPLPNALDDNAIAPDKAALEPGQQASLANYTSYVHGINGIMVDIDGLAEPSAISDADFIFRVGNGNDPSTWTPGPLPDDIDVRFSQGANNSDRITLTFADGAITGQWLEVTVLANDHTGLLSDDVFYYGNAVGETGNCGCEAKVDIIDLLLTRNNPYPFFNPASLDTLYDFNRDRRVNAIDTLIARNHQTWSGTELNLINPATQSAVASRTASTAEPVVGKTLFWPRAPSIRDTLFRQSAQRAFAIDWLGQFDDNPGQRRRESNGKPAQQAVDKLLALHGQ